MLICDISFVYILYQRYVSPQLVRVPLVNDQVSRVSRLGGQRAPKCPPLYGRLRRPGDRRGRAAVYITYRWWRRLANTVTANTYWRPIS